METILFAGVLILSCVVLIQQLKIRKMYLDWRTNQDLFKFITELSDKVASINGLHVHIPSAYYDNRVDEYQFTPIGAVHSPILSFSVFVKFNCGERYFVGVIEVHRHDVQYTNLDPAKLFPLLFNKIDKELMMQVWKHEREC